MDLHAQTFHDIVYGCREAFHKAGDPSAVWKVVHAALGGKNGVEAGSAIADEVVGRRAALTEKQIRAVADALPLQGSEKEGAIARLMQSAEAFRQGDAGKPSVTESAGTFARLRTGFEGWVSRAKKIFRRTDAVAEVVEPLAASKMRAAERPHADTTIEIVDEMARSSTGISRVETEDLRGRERGASGLSTFPDSPAQRIIQRGEDGASGQRPPRDPGSGARR